ARLDALERGFRLLLGFLRADLDIVAAAACAVALGGRRPGRGQRGGVRRRRGGRHRGWRRSGGVGARLRGERQRRGGGAARARGAPRLGPGGRGVVASVCSFGLIRSVRTMRGGPAGSIGGTAAPGAVGITCEGTCAGA